MHNEQAVINKPTSQDIEKALINIIKAGLYYRNPKDSNFMQGNKDGSNKLRYAEDIFLKSVQY
jgi:hypothetical protein